jgi:predicted SAM-dependent methyltransferase
VILRKGVRVLRNGAGAAWRMIKALRTRYVNRRLAGRVAGLNIRRVNLCSGSDRVSGYYGIDVNAAADLALDLATYDLPFAAETLEIVVCMSAINYFSRHRAQQIIEQTYRALKRGGVARFGVQDMKALARKYVEADEAFFFQKGHDGKDRFEGPTIGDKFAAWFYSYFAGRSSCKYFYDYESLAHLFLNAGFSIVERREFQDSRIEEGILLDNRPEQMFYLEAVK